MGDLAVTIKVNVALLADALVSSLQSGVLHIRTGWFSSSSEFGPQRSERGALRSSTSYLTFPPKPFPPPRLLISSPPGLPACSPHPHFSLRRLPLSLPLSASLSEHLIKGASPNEITPRGLIAWLIDRHTAGRGLRPSLVPSGVFFFPSLC